MSLWGKLGIGAVAIIGAAVASVPEFPGSDQQKTRAVPIFSASYGRYFLGPVPGGGPLGIGATLYEAGGLRLGAALSTDIGKLREESDDPRLAGLGLPGLAHYHGPFSSPHLALLSHFPALTHLGE